MVTKNYIESVPKTIPETEISLVHIVYRSRTHICMTLYQGYPTHGPQARIRPAKPTRPTDTAQHEKYFELVARLTDNFQHRFEDFRKCTDIMKLLSDSFQVDPTGAAVNYQMKLTDIQNDSDLKRAFSEQDLLRFDSGYVSSDSYPNLSQDAKNFTALFGSTYCCEQLFRE